MCTDMYKPIASILMSQAHSHSNPEINSSHQSQFDYSSDHTSPAKPKAEGLKLDASRLKQERPSRVKQERFL